MITEPICRVEIVGRKYDIAEDFIFKRLSISKIEIQKSKK